MNPFVKLKDATKEYKMGEISMKALNGMNFSIFKGSGRIESITANKGKQSVEGIEW